MNNLLTPSIIAFRRQAKLRRGKMLSALIAGGCITIFGIFFGLYMFLAYVIKAPMLGPILGPVIGSLIVNKLLEMIIVALFCMIVFSSIIAAFSVFYLDDEIRLLISSPVAIANIFWSRFVLMLVESSWMASIFFLPIFLAFCAASKAPFWAFFLYPVYLFIYLLLPNVLGGLTALILGSLFPIRQMRKVFQFLSVLVLAGMVFFFRYLEPEKLLNPNYFPSVSTYILSLRTSSLDWFPSTYLREASLHLFAGRLSDSLEAFLPLIGMVLSGLLLLHLFAAAFYRISWQKSLEAVENQVLSLEWVRRILIYPFRWFSHDVRVVCSKEITFFFRDPAVFSQLFMMIAIVIVYGYNLSILPLKDLPQLYSGEMNDTLVYFNGPFIGFILAAISMRFVYPSISLEGRAFWVVKSSPIPPSRLMVIKFFLYLIPNMLLGWALCMISNSLFVVTSQTLRVISFANVTIMAVVTTALAIGLGAVYARFDMDNPLKVAGSFGGFVYMIANGLFIINLLACQVYPMYRFYFSRFYPLRDLTGKVLIGFSLTMLLVCVIAWSAIPLIRGREAIERYEPN
ncbi:MAG: hypothetical protein HQM09_06080 [Candidatus Riflebacteria bacterium]|nr:hypothetical protein [Candidatus Riflebacteria bacterium]